MGAGVLGIGVLYLTKKNQTAAPSVPSAPNENPALLPQMGTDVGAVGSTAPVDNPQVDANAAALSALQQQIATLAGNIAAFQTPPQQPVGDTTAPNSVLPAGYSMQSTSDQHLTTVTASPYITHIFATQNGKNDVTVTYLPGQMIGDLSGFDAGVKAAQGVFLDHKWFSWEQYVANGMKEAGLEQKFPQGFQTPIVPSVQKSVAKPVAKASSPYGIYVGTGKAAYVASGDKVYTKFVGGTKINTVLNSAGKVIATYKFKGA